VKIAEINMMHTGSTGKIMFAIADMARQKGNTVKTYSPIYYHKNTPVEFGEIQNHTYFGSRFENFVHVRLAQLTGFLGCFSFFGTYELVRKLKEFNPDLIHLHNLHNWTMNHPMLFRYIKKNNIPVVWTLHDCWAFTGKCPHFIAAKCDRWKNGCGHCPQIREYPQGMIDRTRLMYRLKKKWFSGIENMTLVTPSKWLAELVKESFLSEYSVQVINNGIDLTVFSPTINSFRRQYSIPDDKHIVLGVAFGWGNKKGLDVFIRLANTLGEAYQIVLVGTDENVDRQLPKNIIAIHRTHNQKELAEIYSAADVFVNPTREEVLGMVNIEALACGTPVITFDSGGSPECIDRSCGIVIPCEKVDLMGRAIRYVCTQTSFSQAVCTKRATKFDMRDRFREYVQLYEKVVVNTEQQEKDGL